MAPIATKANTKAPVAAPTTPGKALSMLPSDMSTGLIDDFDGEIVRARYAPFNYGGKREDYVCAAELTIKPDDGEEFTQNYSVGGDINDFCPSNDGDNPVDLNSDNEDDHRGIYVIPVGTKTKMSRTSNWGVFLTALENAGHKGIAADIRFLEGQRAHFNRMEQKPRSGVIARPTDEDGKPQRPREVLVITQLLEGRSATAAPAARPAAAATKAPAAPAPKAAPAAAGGDLDVALAGIVIGAATEDGFDKKGLATLAMKALPGPQKAKGVKRIVEDDFLNSVEGVLYDESEGKIYIAPAE